MRDSTFSGSQLFPGSLVPKGNEDSGYETIMCMESYRRGRGCHLNKLMSNDKSKAFQLCSSVALYNSCSCYLVIINNYSTSAHSR